MGKRLLIHIVVQLCMLILVGSMAAFTAITMVGAIGGVAMAVLPEPTFGLVAGIVCPDGTLEYYDVQRSYHEPGESEPHLECVSPDGTKEDVILQAAFAVLALTFFAVCGGALLLGYLPLALIAFFGTRKVLASWEANKNSF